ncbi:MAG: tRNA guanosine(15) transglycosylase TgtA [Desulfurococcales archaeon]|nr:tRNA guanosine(15) transglycosylase TgtA [Desulfurococcales archaeon]
MFEVKDVDLAGRIGILSSRGKRIETPAFMPVVDPIRQELPLEQIRNAGFDQIITNAYLILKRFGERAVEEGIHGILGFNGMIMTDSGAYQILEYGSIDVSQEEILHYQIAIGSNIGVILDHPTGDVGLEEARRSVEITLNRAKEAEDLISGTDLIWVLPIQGGRHFDLVEYSAMKSKHFKSYGMYGIGSPTVFLERYMYDVVLEIIYRAKKHLPPGKPVHLFGAGHPLILPFAVALGVDTFDSASYILYARDGRYMTEYGVYRIEDLEYLPCNCPVCSRYSASEFRDMPREERTRLLALHNLYTINRMIRRIKQSIREGRLWELLEEVSKRHPQAYSTFQKILNYNDYIERFTPRVKGIVKGLRVYNIESLYNPKISRFRFKLLKLKPPPPSIYEGKASFYPLTRNTECSRSDREFTVYYVPYIGIIPSPLCGVYPSTQFDYPHTVPSNIIEDLASNIRSYISLLRSMGFTDINIYYVENIEWSVRIARLLRDQMDINIVSLKILG